MLTNFCRHIQLTNLQYLVLSSYVIIVFWATKLSKNHDLPITSSISMVKIETHENLRKIFLPKNLSDK